MDCPRCRQPMVSRVFGEVPAQICRKCTGMFLRHGDLNRIAEPTDGDLEFSTVHQDSFEHEDRFGSAVCPQCENQEMRKVEFNIHTSLILDYCDECEGFWLDGLELDRINQEVRELNRVSDDSNEPPMLWFARFIWSLPR